MDYQKESSYPFFLLFFSLSYSQKLYIEFFRTKLKRKNGNSSGIKITTFHLHHGVLSALAVDHSIICFFKFDMPQAAIKKYIYIFFDNFYTQKSSPSIPRLWRFNKKNDTKKKKRRSPCQRWLSGSSQILQQRTCRKGSTNNFYTKGN